MLKQRIVAYFEENDLIREEHHGGRKNHSTLSAKAVLEEAAARSLDKNRLGLLVSTDLTAAFDCVDHKTMKKKLEYYGLKGNMKKLIESYLDERYEYVELESACSKVKQSLPCSSIQGSKLSGFLYTIYTNEVTILHKLMKDKEWLETKLKVKYEKYKEVEHETTNFVDDGNSMISFEDENEANHYLNRYFDILKHFYNLNQLKLNPEKTSILVIAKKTVKERNTDIRIITEPGEDDVEPKKSINVLGWIFNSRLSMDESLQKINTKIKVIMSKVKTITPYMTEKQRLTFANSYMMPLLNYGVQSYVTENQTIKQKYYRITMNIARWVKQSYCFRMSCNKILKTLKWQLPNQKMKKEAVKLIHQVMMTKQP